VFGSVKFESKTCKNYNISKIPGQAKCYFASSACLREFVWLLAGL